MAAMPLPPAPSWDVHPGTTLRMKNETTAWDLPIPSTRILGLNNHAISWYIAGIYRPLPVSRVLTKEQRKTGCSFILSVDVLIGNAMRPPCQTLK